MPRILVSYRRADTAYLATMLHEMLAERFGGENVFIDVDSIPAGRDFRKHLEQAVTRCDIVLALIDEHWLDARDEIGRRRLDQPADWVRLELETALGRDIPVIPLLVSGACIPPEEALPAPLRGLAYRQALPLRSGRDFKHDVEMIGDEIQRAYAEGAKGSVKPPRSHVRTRYLAAVAVLAGFVGVATMVVRLVRPNPEQPSKAAVTATVVSTEEVRRDPSTITTVAPTGETSGIEGTWYAEVPYSWGIRESEQFEFTVAGDRLLGTASFGGNRYPRRILDGKVTGDSVNFIIRLAAGDEKDTPTTYQYRGHLVGTRLEFILDNEGNPPTRFVAARTIEEAMAAVPKQASGGTDPHLASIDAGPYPIDQIKLRVLDHLDAIKQCYVATEFDSVDHAYVYYLVKIDPAGSAVEVRPPGTDERSVELDRCMDRVLRAVDWGRPPKTGGAEIKLGFTALPAWRSQ
jgi:TIR domain